MIKSFPVLRRLGLAQSFFVLVLLLVLSSFAHATELTDLGEGLSYLRVHALGDTAKGLTAAIRERDYLVLDLRYATTTAESADLIRTALAAREFKQPVFILVSPATPRALAESLMAIANKFLTIGVQDSIPTPQVIIDQTTAADRLAYEALESGQTLASLTSGKIVKERFDESALMKEFNSGNINAAPPPAPDPTTKPATSDPKTGAITTAKPVEPTVVSHVEPLIDRVLQRAIHLQRAMLALKPKSQH